MQPTQTFAGPDGRHILAPITAGQFRPVQAARLAVLGVLFWLAAVLFIRHGIPAGFFGGAAGALLFALTVPAALLLIWTCKRMAALRTDQLVAGVAVASAAALFCDGIALTWAPRANA